MRPPHRPPPVGRWLVVRFVPEGPARVGLLGDLEEMYRDRLRFGRGRPIVRRVRADAWFVAEAVFAALRYRPFIERWVVRFAEGRRPRRTAPLDLLRELNLARRQLAQDPGFSVASTLTLALGFSAAAVIFAVVRGVIVAPLPFPEPDRLVVIEHRLPGYPSENGEVVFGAFQGQVLHYAERSRELVEVGAYGTFDGAITEVESPRYTRLGYATSGFFRALGVQPVAGRLFGPEEPQAAGNGLGSAIVSHALAMQRYGDTAPLPGKVIATEGFEYEIVGVLPSRMPFPPDPADVWHGRSESMLRDNPVWTVDALVARMAPGATPDSVERELAALLAEIPDRFAGTAIESVARDGRMAPRVTPMKRWLLGDAERALWSLMAAVLVVMTMACVNVANLVIVRTDARREELAVRVALGAGQTHIARYFLAESLILSAAAGGLALAFAGAAVRSLPRLVTVGLPRLDEVAASDVLVPIAALSVLTAAILAILPLAARRVLTSSPRQPSTRTHGAGRRQRRARHLLAGFQLAMAVVLLVGTGLILRSVHALAAVDPGFEADGVLTFRVAFPYREIVESGAAGRATRFYDELAERVATLPGVVSTGYGICVPMAQTCALDGYPVKREEAPATDAAEQPLAGLQPVSPGFVETLGIPLLAGRGLEPGDHRQRTDVALVSAGLAERLWPGGDPLGKRLEQGGGSTAQNFHFTVVGVVDDIRFDRLRDEPELVVYTPVLFSDTNHELFSASFAVRSEVSPRSLIDDVRALVADMRADVPVAEVQTMATLVTLSTAQLRLALKLLSGAALAALALSAIGAYGVVSYVVGLRRAEFGIRLALGARPADVLLLVLRDGAVLTGLGVATGLAGALLLTRYLSTFLFEVQPLDPLAFGAAATLLAAVGIGASVLPARRAARVDPVTTLAD